MNNSKKVALKIAALHVCSTISLIALPLGEIIYAIIFFHWTLLSVYLYQWCGEYVRDKGIKEVGALKMLAGLIPPIGIPVFLVRYLGFTSGVKGTLLISAILFGCLFIELVIVGLNTVTISIS